MARPPGFLAKWGPGSNLFSLHLVPTNTDYPVHLPICCNVATLPHRPRKESVVWSTATLWDTPQRGCLTFDTLAAGCSLRADEPHPPSWSATEAARLSNPTLRLDDALRSAPYPELRVVTVNCGGLRGKVPQLLRILVYTNADIILLQEVGMTAPCADIPAKYLSWWSVGPTPFSSVFSPFLHHGFPHPNSPPPKKARVVSMGGPPNGQCSR